MAISRVQYATFSAVAISVAIAVIVRLRKKGRSTLPTCGTTDNDIILKAPSNGGHTQAKEDTMGVSTTLGIMYQSAGHYRCVVDRKWCGCETVNYEKMCSILAFCLHTVKCASSKLSDSSYRQGVYRPRLLKMERFLAEIREQLVAAPEMWILGRMESVRELCTRVEALKPSRRKLVALCTTTQRYTSVGRDDVCASPLVQDFLDVLPIFQERVWLFLGEDCSPEDCLLESEEVFRALSFCLDQLATEPYDNPIDEDSHYANITTQDTRRKN